MSLCIGNFDGVHIGHQSLLARLQELPPPRAMMSFEPHPAAVFSPNKPIPRLYDWREKFYQARAAGLDALYLIRFNQALAARSADDFENLLFLQMGVKNLIVGDNFRYGNQRRGSVEQLRSAAAQHNAAVVAAPLFSHGERVVASGWVKEAVAAGDFALAEKLLGRAWAIRGRVVRGQQRGRVWGVPTANLRIGFLPPCVGIFAGYAEVNEGGERGANRYPAAISIGYNPTVRSGGGLSVEAHLLDFAGDLYGQRIALVCQHKIRDEQRFDSTETMVTQIKDDIQQTRARLAGAA